MLRSTRQNKTWRTALAALAFVALVVGCESDDSVADGGGDEDVITQDTPSSGSDAVSSPGDAVSGEDSASSEDTGQPPEPEREVVYVTLHRACYGCQSVSVCNWPAVSDMTGVELGASLNNQSGVLFAMERWEAAGRALPLDTCKLFTGAELDAVIEVPVGVEGMDGGAISLGGEMSLLTPPMEIGYSATTRTYESTIRFASEESPYQPGGAIALEGAGGEAVRPFLEEATAPDPFEILTPSVDAEGQIANIATDQPLEVTWTGGEDFDDAVLILHGFYCLVGPDSFVACRVRNDGAHTIGLDVLSQITWPNAVELLISMSDKLPMAAPELTDGAAWSNRSAGWLYVWWDPDAEPSTGTDCDSDSMAEGFVGAACESNDDCGGGCCLMAVDDYFTGNYCTLLGCASDDDCPADALCMEQTNPFIGVPDYCAKVCASDDDCRGAPAYACMDRGDGNSVCRPGLW